MSSIRPSGCDNSEPDVKSVNKGVFRKIVSLLVTTLVATAALAAPTPSKVNASALQILLANSGKLRTEDGTRASSVLAEALVTGNATHNKISNNCVYDKGDSVYKCSLMILNADDKQAGRTESSTEIQYELEKDSAGMPSSDMGGNLTIQVNQAG